MFVPAVGGGAISVPIEEQLAEAEVLKLSYEYEQLVAMPHDTYGDHVVSWPLDVVSTSTERVGLGTAYVYALPLPFNAANFVPSAEEVIEFQPLPFDSIATQEVPESEE